ncbi:hypothetical protein R1sor_001402 [Riccia sorocarpa]|uniref:Uncharacterized protein n=1 Tax=Riccia sorocarpa TaxID=122646 RepID=A0ABD3GZ47_9MARC
MTSRGQGVAEGRGNRRRDDRSKRPMVDPHPIREPVDEVFEEGELCPIIMVQPTTHPRLVEAREGSSAQKKKKKKQRLENRTCMEGVVSYVAKKCNEMPPNNAWVMMHKKLASFAETHCAIVRPIACHNIETELILVYPYWNASVNGVKYNRNFPGNRDWIALELVDWKIRDLAAKRLSLIQSTSITKQQTCLGVLTKKVCGDFFTDMTRPEMIAYNEKMYAEGPTRNTSPCARNAVLLKELIESATHDYCGLQKSAAQCFTQMSDLMKITP